MGKGVSSRDLSHTDRGKKNGGSQFTFHGLTITLGEFKRKKRLKFFTENVNLLPHRIFKIKFRYLIFLFDRFNDDIKFFN